MSYIFFFLFLVFFITSIEFMIAPNNVFKDKTPQAIKTVKILVIFLTILFFTLARITAQKNAQENPSQQSQRITPTAASLPETTSFPSTTMPEPTSLPKAPPTQGDSFQALSEERFKGIEEEWKKSGDELDRIECFEGDCTSLVYFQFNSIPEDLDFVIRGNTATFSNFKLQKTGVSHVTVIGAMRNTVLMKCNGAGGKVSECE